MKIVIGLGNIGESYARTFHNAGFLAVDALAEKLGARFLKKECDALTAHTEVNGGKVIIAKPQTYMNLSGSAAKKLCNYYKCEVSDVIVIFDDIDLPKGTVRYRASGSGGTHNGVKDIVLKLGQGFQRIKIGVGPPPPFMDLASFVLSNIPAIDKDIINAAIGSAVDKVLDLF